MMLFHFSSSTFTTPSNFSPLAKAMMGEKTIGKPTSAFPPPSYTLSSSRDSPPPIVVLPPTRPSTAVSGGMPLQLPPQVLSAAAAAAAAEAAAAVAKKEAIANNTQDDRRPNTEDREDRKLGHNTENGNNKENTPESTNDLADVQSMLTMAKTGVHNKLDESDAGETTENEKSVSGHEGVCLIEDPIIRDMKLKGEFPCRLCPAVYPNLRALKGHNKEHLGKPPYVCNVGACNYSSNDKSTLTRHMRTHTGEKPFECKLCNYGFTTKANCERHLKNKHGKTSREAIKTSIIVHESEDPEAMSGATAKMMETEEQKMQFRCKVCKQIFPSSDKVIAHAYTDHPAYSNDVDHIFEEIKRSNSLAKMLLDDGSPSMVPRPVTMIDQLKTCKKQQQHQQQQQQLDHPDSHDSEAPLDLSQPSRPGSSETNGKTADPPVSATTPSIYSNLPPLKMHGKIPMMAPNINPAVAAAMPGILPSGFPYILPATSTTADGASATSQLNPQLRPGGFPLLFPFLPANQALMANFMNFSLESLPLELREQMNQRLAQSAAVIPQGGGANPEDLASLMQQAYLRKQTELKEQKEAAEALQHLSKVQSTTVVGKAPPPALPRPSSTSEKAASTVAASEAVAASAASADSRGQQNSDSDSNYKMIIKNGVLMKKQKQRRYRTERPYSCNHCEARFTLRSNMERHIKQQHPQHWCQKPRGSRRNHTATVPVLAPQFRNQQDMGALAPSDQDDRSTSAQDKYDDKYDSNKKDRTQDSIEDEEEEEGFEVSDNGEDGSLIIDEPSTSSPVVGHSQDTQDLVSVTKLLNTATNQSFQKYFDQEEDEAEASSGSNNTTSPVERKKSAYSAAPHKIACPYCERKFPWTSSLRRHILTHTGQKPFKCPECNLWFTTKSNCDRHLVRKHGGNNNNGHHEGTNNILPTSVYTMRNVPDRPFKCKMCPSSTFSSQSNLRKHHMTKHLDMEYTGEDNEEGDDEFSMEESMDQDPSPFKCHICSIGFEVRALALTHMRGSHPEECASIEASVSNKLLESGVSPSNTPSNLNGSSSMPKEGVECIFCPFVCKTFFELRKHVSKDHGVKYTCDICQKSFSLKKLLVRHKKKHDSGVSSGDESDNETNTSKLATPLLNNRNAGIEPSPKKKPSLMDTINKLASKRNDSSGNSLDNLFHNKEITAVNSA